MSKSFYKVYIACMTKRPDGNPVRDYVLAKELYRKTIEESQRKLRRGNDSFNLFGLAENAIVRHRQEGWTKGQNPY